MKKFPSPASSSKRHGCNRANPKKFPPKSPPEKNEGDRRCREGVCFLATPSLWF